MTALSRPLTIGRCLNWLKWRIYAAQTRLGNRLSVRQGWLSRRVRCLVPGFEPYRRRELHLERRGALGDVLMCTPALRLLRQINPDCRVTFYTDFPALIESLALADEVLPISEVPPGVIYLRYEDSRPPRRHIARIIGDHLGLNIRDVRPVCFVDSTLRDGYAHQWRDLPKPWISVNRYASTWTPNKEWPSEHWNELVARLLRWGTVIEIGTGPRDGPVGTDGSYVDLTGHRPLNDLIAIIAAADLHVGPISGPVHIAAACGRPSIVIYGGYEDPACSSYAGNINLGTSLPCSPCWLRDPCPFDRACLRQISPSAVEASVRRLWSGSAF